MVAPTGLVGDLCVRRFAPRSFASLEDDATGHGEGFWRPYDV